MFALLKDTCREQANKLGEHYKDNFAELDNLSRFVLEHPEAGRKAGLPNCLIRAEILVNSGSTRFHCNAIDLSNQTHITAYSETLQTFCQTHVKKPNSLKYENFNVYVILHDVRTELEAIDASNVAGSPSF